MSNSNAEKYFRVFDENFREEHNLDDDTIKRVIDKVTKKVGENAKVKPKESFYTPPTPEKTISQNKKDSKESLDDLIKKFKNIPSQPSRSSSSNKLNPKPSPSSYPQNNTAHPFKYFVGELMGSVNNHLVPNSQEPIYVAIRKIAPLLLGTPKNYLEEKGWDFVLGLGSRVINEIFINKKSA